MNLIHALKLNFLLSSQAFPAMQVLGAQRGHTATFSLFCGWFYGLPPLPATHECFLADLRPQIREWRSVIPLLKTTHHGGAPITQKYLYFNVCAFPFSPFYGPYVGWWEGYLSSPKSD
uniref:Uncharacterized protein n=2 Tax=Opuntia streptacantha TaxID=393608 RepID=A0A7C8Z783_OPUST